MRYDQYYLVIHRYSPSGRFCENGISLTFILRRSVPPQLHAGTVRLWRWNSNHSDLGSKKLTIIFQIFSIGTSALMIGIRKLCISEFTDKLEFKNLCGSWSCKQNCPWFSADMVKLLISSFNEHKRNP